MTTNKYNGYANYETWSVALWLDNDGASHRYWREAAEGPRRAAKDSWQVREDIWTAERAPVYLLAERLKEVVWDARPELGANLYSDLLHAALSEVEWHEVAESVLEE